MKYTLLILVAVLQINICFTATKIEDFKIGTKIRLSNGQQRPWKKDRGDPTSTTCKTEDICSTSGEVKIQVSKKMCPSCLSKWETREDLGFVYYALGAVSYCKGSGWFMSADFSGCLMTVWAIEGNRFVGHVDTADDKVFKCKALMKDTTGTFFKPYANDDETTKLKEALNKKVHKDSSKDPLGFFKAYQFGLVSDKDEFYSMYMTLSKIDGQAFIFEVAEVPRRRTAVNLNEIKN